MSGHSSENPAIIPSLAVEQYNAERQILFDAKGAPSPTNETHDTHLAEHGHSHGHTPLSGEFHNHFLEHIQHEDEQQRKRLEIKPSAHKRITARDNDVLAKFDQAVRLRKPLDPEGYYATVKGAAQEYSTELAVQMNKGKDSQSHGEPKAKTPEAEPDKKKRTRRKAKTDVVAPVPAWEPVMKAVDVKPIDNELERIQAGLPPKREHYTEEQAEAFRNPQAFPSEINNLIESANLAFQEEQKVRQLWYDRGGVETQDPEVRERVLQELMPQMREMVYKMRRAPIPPELMQEKKEIPKIDSTTQTEEKPDDRQWLSPAVAADSRDKRDIALKRTELDLPVTREYTNEQLDEITSRKPPYQEPVKTEWEALADASDVNPVDQEIERIQAGLPPKREHYTNKDLKDFAPDEPSEEAPQGEPIEVEHTTSNFTNISYLISHLFQGYNQSENGVKKTRIEVLPPEDDSKPAMPGYMAPEEDLEIVGEYTLGAGTVTGENEASSSRNNSPKQTEAGAGNPHFNLQATGEAENTYGFVPKRNDSTVTEGNNNDQTTEAVVDTSSTERDIITRVNNEQNIKLETKPIDLPAEINNLVTAANLNESQIAEVRQIWYKNQELEMGDITDLIKNKIKEFTSDNPQSVGELSNVDILATITNAKPPEPKKFLGITIKSAEDESSRFAREAELKKAITQAFSIIAPNNEANISYQRKVDMLKELLHVPHAKEFILNNLEAPKETATDENVRKMLYETDFDELNKQAMTYKELEWLAHRFIQYSMPDVLARQLLEPKYAVLLNVIKQKFIPQPSDYRQEALK